MSVEYLSFLASHCIPHAGKASRNLGIHEILSVCRVKELITKEWAPTTNKGERRTYSSSGVPRGRGWR